MQNTFISGCSVINKLLIALAFVNIAAGACSSIGSDRYYCASTGDNAADGVVLRDFINAKTFACGSTIILDAGAEYTLPSPLETGIWLKQQTGCASGAYTTITSSGSEDILIGPPVDPYANPAYIANLKKHMARIDTLSPSAIIYLGKNANQWKFVGILLTSHPSMATNGPTGIGTVVAGYVYNGPDYTSLSANALAFTPNDIWFDRCMSFPIEEELYGPAAVTNTDGRAWSRTATNPFSPDAYNFKITNSYVYGVNGYRKIVDSTSMSVNNWCEPGGGGAIATANATCKVVTTAGQTFTVAGTATATLSGTAISGTIYAYWSSAGVLTFDENTAATLTCSNCSTASTGGFPVGSYPIATYTFINNVLGGLSDKRASADTAGAAFSSVTNANPVTVTSPGISIKLGLTPVMSATPSCSKADADLGRCNLRIIQGATGNWVPVNGAVMCEYVDADHVRLWKMDRIMSVYGATKIDSTGFGPLTGTVTAYNTSINLPLYAFHMNYGSLTLINNLLESTGMIMLLGGDDAPAIDPARVISSTGCTVLDACRITLDHVRGLEIGTMVAVDVPDGSGHSRYYTYPPFSPALFANDPTRRAGIVTAINGTTITLAAQGPQGIDVAPAGYPLSGQGTGVPYFRGHEIEPTVRGYATWQGAQVGPAEIRRNWFYKNVNTPFSGKGFTEIKSCNNCLHDGNMMGPGWMPGMFTTTHSQQGGSVWTNLKNFAFSNEMMGGPDGAWPRMVIAGVDQLNTSAFSDNVIFRNILYPEVIHRGADYYGTTTFNTAGLGGDSGWDHVTIPIVIRADNIQVGGAGECGNDPHPYQTSRSDTGIRNSVFGAKAGLSVFPNPAPWPDCWPGVTAANNTIVAHNVIVDYLGVGGLAAAWPGLGNTIKADYSFFVGSCTYAAYDQCEISASSGLKGTASDGKDPGADIPQMKDHLKGWSEDAGLTAVDIYVASTFNNPSAFLVGSNRMGVNFRLLGGGVDTCTFELYTDASRQTLHADTNSASNKACWRTGNLYNEGVVSFVLGTVSGLSPSSTYHFKITEGSRVMVGSFQTAPSAVDDNVFTVQLSDPDAAALVVEYSQSAAFSALSSTSAPFQNQLASATFTIPKGQAWYYRWKKVSGGGALLATGPITVAVAP